MRSAHGDASAGTSPACREPRRGFALAGGAGGGQQGLPGALGQGAIHGVDAPVVARCAICTCLVARAPRALVTTSGEARRSASARRWLSFDGTGSPLGMPWEYWSASEAGLSGACLRHRFRPIRISLRNFATACVPHLRPKMHAEPSKGRLSLVSHILVCCSQSARANGRGLRENGFSANLHQVCSTWCSARVFMRVLRHRAHVPADAAAVASMRPSIT